MSEKLGFDPRKTRGPHFASGEIPEDYRGPTERGTSDYPKSREGFVPLDQIAAEDTTTVEEAEEDVASNMEAIKTEEQNEEAGDIAKWKALKDDERKKRWHQEIEAGWSPRRSEANRKISAGTEILAEKIQTEHDKKTEKERLLEKEPGDIPRYYKKTKKDRVIRGQRPQKVPKYKTVETIFRATKAKQLDEGQEVEQKAA